MFDVTRDDLLEDDSIDADVGADISEAVAETTQYLRLNPGRECSVRIGAYIHWLIRGA